MQPILNFVSGIAVWLYAAAGITLLVALRLFWAALRDRRNTIYGLEKEIAGEHAWTATGLAMLAVIVGGAVYYADNNADHLPPPAPQRSPTPNLSLFITPTATVPPPTSTPAPPTPTPLRGGAAAPASPTPRGAPPTNTPSAPDAPPPPPPSAACPNVSARITSPGVDARLSGNVTVRGSAVIPDFQYYKVEYGVGPNPSGWVVIGELRRQPVADGVLATFNADGFAPGTYALRLMVVDRRGNFPIPPCIVRVFFGQ